MTKKPGLWLAVVGLVLLFFVYVIYPPERNLRLGKDLRGGVSLIYTVEVGPDENARQVVTRVIDVLKDRVDPSGLLEITMVQQGRDRIEVTMPLPGDAPKAARAQYEEALHAIDARALPASRIDRAMQLPSGQDAGADQRTAELERLAGGDPARLAKLKELAAKWDNYLEMQKVLESIPDDSPDKLQMAQDAAREGLDYDRLRDELATGALSGEQVRRALERSSAPRSLRDETKREAVPVPSEREQAIADLKVEYPAYLDLIEAAVQRHEEYESVRRTLDDPSDLMRLLRAAGVLSFRISVDPGELSNEDALREEFQERGPQGARADDAAWFKINKAENWYDSVQDLERLRAHPAGFFENRGYVVEEWLGDYYMLCYDARGFRLTQDSGRRWGVANAFQGQDRLGRPAVSFQMDPSGSTQLGELTGANVGRQMAVLLDDEVYTAPRLNSRISSSGIIEGNFSPEELRYLIRVLSSGALQSKLSPSPISQSVIGPDLGLDNLQQGLRAGIVSLVAVGAFMILYYFRAGAIAVIALGCNALLIVGCMAANQAAFSLPGIAGIILTFGMAVDANVLIFERIREELRAGLDVKPAVRLGFSKALSSIVDGNVTNLIVCVVLVYLGTQEIKGFAITLGIGVVTTMFSALVITRLIFALMLNMGWWKNIKMLPSAIPPIERALEPKINWLKLRYVFIVISMCYVSLGLYMGFVQRGEMLDTEFRGGTQVTLQFGEQDGEEVMLTRADVQRRVSDIALDLDPQDPLWKLQQAEVLPENPQSDGITSNRFKIKTVITDAGIVRDALTEEFSDELGRLSELTFDGMETADSALAPVYPLTSWSGVLGEDIRRPEFRDDVSEYNGGVAIVLENISSGADSPLPSVEEIERRLEQMRAQPDYVETQQRRREVRVLDGSPDAVRTAVVLVADPTVRFSDDADRWQRVLASQEWELTRTALGRTTTLASEQSFSPAIAETFRAQAIVSVALSLLLITIYIWVRFGSVRYSLAAIACLLHDVLTCIGLIALAELLYHSTAVEPVARALGILPFKIDLNMVAALLTIIGYSLNDTIIIMDRIRENRGRLPYATGEIINASINQTISRTVITSGTTLLAILILYVYGGEGIRGFAYAMLIGVGVGTYSSIAVAAPLVWVSGAGKEGAHVPDESPESSTD